MKKYLQNNFNYEADELLEVFDELSIWAAPFGLLLLDQIRLKKNISALDIGFGAGFPLTELAMRLGNSCTVYGIDPWQAAIRRAKKKIAFYGIENIMIIQGEAENIPLETASVDLIVSNNGINNVADLDQALSECSRIMKKGGQFIQTMNLETTMVEFYDILRATLEALNMDSAISQMEEQIYKMRKPLNEIKTLLQAHNFTIKKITHDQFDYKFVDGTTFFNHYSIRLAFLDGWKNIIPADRQTEVFTIIEDKINEQSAIDGYFKLSVPFVCIDCEKG